VVGRVTDVASKQQRTAAALNFIPLYIILAAFVAGMGIAVDSTAGERERKTLEPLLINPIKRYHIVMGKWIASSVFSALGMVLTLVLCVAAMLQVPLDQIGLQFNVSLWQIVLMIIATLPLAFLATSMQLLLGIFAKSFKDAQSYIGFLTLLPVVPSVYIMFNPMATREWMFAIPMLGQHLLLVDVLGGKDVPLIGYVYSAVSCLLLGMGLVLITARFFQKESIISN
jgi:sodium transport system permease protein